MGQNSVLQLHFLVTPAQILASNDVTAAKMTAMVYSGNFGFILVSRQSGDVVWCSGALVQSSIPPEGDLDVWVLVLLIFV